MKTYQKAAALLLALALIFAFPVTASAAETTEARVPVTLTSVNTVIKSVKIGTTSVACFQPGGIHIYRRQIVQCRKIVPHLCVITPQKLVGCSSHVDVEGFTLAALSVKELKYRLIQRRAFEVYPHMMPVIQSRFFKRSAVDDILRISGKECADTRTNYNRM